MRGGNGQQRRSCGFASARLGTAASLLQPIYVKKFRVIPAAERNDNMSIGTILLIVLVLLVIGALPSWPYSSGWGYYPSGTVGLIVVILLVLVLMGRI